MGDVDGFIDKDPGGGFPAAGEGGAPLIGEVVGGLGEQGAEGEVVHQGVVAPVLDLVETRRK